jgi:hypothetical protein
LQAVDFAKQFPCAQKYGSISCSAIEARPPRFFTYFVEKIVSKAERTIPSA